MSIDVRNTQHQVRLTSAEVANLWTQYMSDSLAVCFLSHALVHAKDPEARSLLTMAIDMAQGHIEAVKGFQSSGDFPLPIGFTEEDLIDKNAPALFSDMFLLNYLSVMCIVGLTSYAGALSTSTRADQRAFFSKCNTETMELYNRIMDAMLEKGVIERPASLNPTTRTDFVRKQSYLTGWFGERRPMNAIEISSAYYNMVKLEVKVTLETAFCQVCRSPEVREYLLRGAKLCDKQFKELNARLAADHLPSPNKWESHITDAVAPAFSDKLMLFHVVTLVSASAAFYGAALSVSQRRDLGAQYVKQIGEMALYAEDGANLLIEKGWLEQPPTADEREALMHGERNR
ncbi:DUF3231 family protein [Paenibacillus sp. TRM 82003]|nr:DUF3231 family protein [Paenibacillus sp. TRM 82003]